MTHLFALPVAAALFAIAILLDVPQQPGHEQLLVVLLASSICIAVLSLSPRRDLEAADSLKSIVSDAGIATAMFIATSIVASSNALHTMEILRIALTCLLLIILLMSILSASHRYGENSRQFVIIGFVALLATPVWLGPLAEMSGNVPWITNAIVAISPVSLFATALDLDVLRTSWFYEHSVLGSLRYTYPSWGATVAVLAILTCLTLTPKFLKRRAKL